MLSPPAYARLGCPSLHLRLRQLFSYMIRRQLPTPQSRTVLRSPAAVPRLSSRRDLIHRAAEKEDVLGNSLRECKNISLTPRWVSNYHGPVCDKAPPDSVGARTPPPR